MWATNGRFRLRSTAHPTTEWNPRPNIQQSRCLQEDDLRNKPIMHERWHHSSTVPHTPRCMSQPWLLVGNCCARTRASVGPLCAAHNGNSIIAVAVSHTQSESKSQFYPYSVSKMKGLLQSFLKKHFRDPEPGNFALTTKNHSLGQFDYW